MIDKSIDWTHYLTRNFSLLGCSLWNAWYSSQIMQEVFNFRIRKILTIEQKPGLARRYYPKKDLFRLKEKIAQLIKENPQRCLKLLEEAEQLNKQAKEILEQKKEAPFKEALNFHIEQAVKSTVFPFNLLRAIEEFNLNNEELKQKAEKFRTVTYYPDLIEHYVIPAAKKYLTNKDVELLTLKEILAKKVEQLESRKQQRSENKKVVYQMIDEEEEITWHENTQPIINELEGIQKNQQLQGKTAYSGKVTGIARLCLTEDPTQINFNQGDILVTVASSPKLMPIINKAAAIIADEGGISCHAAIISRELKIPCVVGTKYATSIIKDGDKIEVNAEKGTIKILEK